jgi:hypothetical protein
VAVGPELEVLEQEANRQRVTPVKFDPIPFPSDLALLSLQLCTWPPSRSYHLIMSVPVTRTGLGYVFLTAVYKVIEGEAFPGELL